MFLLCLIFFHIGIFAPKTLKSHDYPVPSDDEIVNNFEKFNYNDKMIYVRSVIFIQKFSKNLVNDWNHD